MLLKYIYLLTGFTLLMQRNISHTARQWQGKQGLAPGLADWKESHDNLKQKVNILSSLLVYPEKSLFENEKKNENCIVLIPQGN